MKKTSVREKGKIKRANMKAQYRFDYSKAKPNRFAAKMSGCAVAVVLDPDVALVFKSSEAVNAFLRSVICAMPASKHGQAG